MTNILEAKNLTFSYKSNQEDTLKNVNLSVKKGSFTGLVGPNGCGKSTLFKCLIGELEPKEGQVLYEGANLHEMKPKERARKIAIVHQKNQTIQDFTVHELVKMGRTPYSTLLSTFTEDDKRAVDNALYLVGMEEFKDRYCHELSGGQLQRVWLALALAQEPDLILLDEPTTYLDVKYQIQLLDMTKELVENHGISCLAILHDLNQTINYADYTYFMDKGKIFDEGPSAKVLNRDNIKKIFEVEVNILESIDDRKVLDIYLNKEDKNVHKDIKPGQILQI